MGSASTSLVNEGVVTVVAGRFEALIGRGLTSIIGDDDRVVILDSDVESTKLERVAMELAPDAAIVDEAGLRLLSPCVRAIQAATGVIVLARDPTHSYGMVLLAAGVTCIACNASTGQILDSLHVACQGGCMFVSADGHRIEQPNRADVQILTKRENDVLAGLSHEKSHEEIAQHLSISVATVKKHTTRLLYKLGAPSKRELAGVPVFGGGSSSPPAPPSHYEEH
jgi:DNA-binding NarL/FixJ family response regulator